MSFTPHETLCQATVFSQMLSIQKKMDLATFKDMVLFLTIISTV